MLIWDRKPWLFIFACLYPYASFSNQPDPDLSIFLLLDAWPSSFPLSSSPHNSCHFSLKVDNPVQCPIFHKLGGFLSHFCFMWTPLNGGVAYQQSIFSSHCQPRLVHLWAELGAFFLCQLGMRNSHVAICIWTEGVMPLSPIMAGCTSSVKQWIALSWMDVTESRSQSSCLALWSLYIPWPCCLPEACSMPEVFLAWCIILCCTCRGFSLEAKVLQTWHGFQMKSWEPLQTPLITQGLLGHMAVCTTAWTHKRALSCSWAYSELAAFHVTW